MDQIVCVGQRCRKCGTPVEKKVPKKRSPAKAYWYRFYLSCPKCGNMYMLEDEKIINPHYKGPAWKQAWLKGKETQAELDGGYLRNMQALEKIVNAPKLATMDYARDIAKKALDGIMVKDMRYALLKGLGK